MHLPKVERRVNSTSNAGALSSGGAKVTFGGVCRRFDVENERHADGSREGGYELELERGHVQRYESVLGGRVCSA